MPSIAIWPKLNKVVTPGASSAQQKFCLPGSLLEPFKQWTTTGISPTVGYNPSLSFSSISHEAYKNYPRLYVRIGADLGCVCGWMCGERLDFITFIVILDAEPCKDFSPRMVTFIVLLYVLWPDCFSSSAVLISCNNSSTRSFVISHISPRRLLRT